MKTLSKEGFQGLSLSQGRQHWGIPASQILQESPGGPGQGSIWMGWRRPASDPTLLTGQVPGRWGCSEPGAFSSSFRNLYPTACSLPSFAPGNLLLAHVGAWREGHDPGWVRDVLGQRNPQPQQLQGENSSGSTQIPPGRAGLAFPRAEPGTAAKTLIQPGNHSSLSLQPLSCSNPSFLHFSKTWTQQEPRGCSFGFPSR